jgi:hypothetical protein
MKLSRLTAFTLGVVVTAVSVSAVSYVNALNDQTMRACADRKTGAMRYIDKGRCKRTERALTWNQVGPQGLQGATGAQGPAGLTGAAGSNATVETITWNFPYLTTSWGNCPLAFLGYGPTPVGYLIANPSTAYSSSNATPIYSCTARIKAIK